MQSRLGGRWPARRGQDLVSRDQRGIHAYQLWLRITRNACLLVKSKATETTCLKLEMRQN